MTDRRSFLAKLLCLPAAAKAVAVASPPPEMSPYAMFWRPHTFFEPLNYAGEWRWIHYPHTYSAELIKLDRFPPGMGNDIRTPYDGQP